MTSKTTQTTKRQTQKGVARASAARKQTDAQAAKVRNITTARKAAQQQVEQTIADVLTGKTSDAAARTQIDAAVRESARASRRVARAEISANKTAATKAATRKTITGAPTDFVPSPLDDATMVSKRTARKQAAQLAAKQAESTTIKPQDEKRSAVELRDTLRGETALANADAIVAAAKRLQSAEQQLAEKEIDARNPATVESYKVHRDRDAAIQELIELGAGWTFIARVRGVASSTNRGLCRVIMGGKRI
jgi:hypothetical protein